MDMYYLRLIGFDNDEALLVMESVKGPSTGDPRARRPIPKGNPNDESDRVRLAA